MTLHSVHHYNIKTSLCSNTLLFDNTKLMIPNWRSYLAVSPNWPFLINQLIIKQACSAAGSIRYISEFIEF
jgi:hypothetical protein